MNKNIYLLVSSSVTLLDQKIARITKDQDFIDASITTYDLEETPLATVLEDVDTISFLTPKKIVIARRCSFLESGAQEDEKEIEHLLKYIETPSEEVLLILTAEKLDERKKIVKSLRKNIAVEELNPDVDQLLKELLKGYQLESGVKKLLKEYTINNYEKIIHECEKLKLYKIEDKIITISDVKTLIEKPEANKDELAFSFVRSIAEKNKKESFKIYKEMEKVNLEPFAIMGLLESQYRLLYQVIILSNQNMSRDEIAKKLNVHPFRISKTIELTRFYQLKEVSEFLKKLAEIDYKIKSGQMDGTMILELLIINN